MIDTLAVLGVLAGILAVGYGIYRLLTRNTIDK